MGVEKQIRIILVDDHTVVRDGIKLLLSQHQELKVIGEAANGEEALELYNQTTPDLVVMDIRMPVMNGLEATRQLVMHDPSAKVLILSMHNDDDYILHAVRNGASGYILKDANKDELIRAIRSVADGKKFYSGDISGILIKELTSPNIAQMPVAEEENSIEALAAELTKREKEILKHVAEGKSSKDIAVELNKSARTIETHRFNIMKKMKVNSTVELLRKLKGKTF
ncbi:response regulator transcription factor [Sediminitomix flava]|uniref:LuxR family two component transcriptional regulator n=1 Tax=Sediminitomix flava TaxID=379075 RepID=A0A315ZHR9_SEDFL|nr:response regulator transcription factor [Sediminitomix flava]PWJ44763.1 LuxR family two component transcriptional regulator [Sediminitomix flava]